jgi:hypothetical protein
MVLFSIIQSFSLNIIFSAIMAILEKTFWPKWPVFAGLQSSFGIKKGMPVGSEKATECDPRIICAINHGLWKDIEQDKFREDESEGTIERTSVHPEMRIFVQDQGMREK